MKKVLVLTLVGLLLSVMGVSQAAGNAAAGKRKAGVCAGCHGVGGKSTNPMYPKLAGQSAGYIAKQLEDFKSGQRSEPQMVAFVASLSKQDMQDLGAYFAGIDAKPGAATSQTLAEQGKRIYRGGIAKTGVAACMSCHGPSGKGIPPRFPSVSGQHAAYSTKQLLAFKDSVRKNDGEVMTSIAFRMSKDQIKAVSEYMAGLH